MIISCVIVLLIPNWLLSSRGTVGSKFKALLRGLTLLPLILVYVVLKTAVNLSFILLVKLMSPLKEGGKN